MDDSIREAHQDAYIRDLLPDCWSFSLNLTCLNMSFRILFFLSVGAFLWTGCSNVTFEEPMPMQRRNLKDFPNKWQGTWSDGENLTLTINPTSFYDQNSPADSMVIGTDVLLRRFHGYLVISQIGDNGQYQVIVARRWRDEIKVYDFGSNDEAVAVWREVLNGSFEARSENPLEKETYILKPENNLAFRQLLMKGGVTLSSTLVREE
jgi:hypothetical protein